MKTLRILCLSFAALLFAGSVLAVSDGIKSDNMEQVVNGSALAFLALAAPAVAFSNAKEFGFGFMGAGLTRAEEHLIQWLTKSGKIDMNTANDYRNGKLKLNNSFIYIRKLITGVGVGVTELINQRTEFQVGITNLHAGKLEKGVNACIDQILVGYATHATETTPEARTYDSVVSSFPAGLANGHLQIKVDGALAHKPVPIALCGSQADSTASRGMVDSFKLKTPIVLPEQKQIILELDAAVASFASSQHFVEVWLLGSETGVRSDY